MRMREEFDIARSFVTLKAFRFNGDELARGSVFDKSSCSARKLRCLYQSRYLAMASEEDAVATECPKGMPQFHAMKVVELRQWLQENGRKPSERIRKKRLVERAIRLWRDLNSSQPNNVGE